MSRPVNQSDGHSGTRFADTDSASPISRPGMTLRVFNTSNYLQNNSSYLFRRQEHMKNRTRRRHNTERWQVCPHTCPGTRCTSGTGSEAWRVNSGSNIHKHAGVQRKHPNCTPDCPAYAWLQSKISKPHNYRLLTSIDKLQINSEYHGT